MMTSTSQRQFVDAPAGAALLRHARVGPRIWNRLAETRYCRAKVSCSPRAEPSDENLWSSRHWRQVAPGRRGEAADQPVGWLLAVRACRRGDDRTFEPADIAEGRRSEERRVGEECVRECNTRWSRY